jgi:hypothetical protein
MSGIIIFPIVLIYIFVAFLIYKLVLKNTNKKFLSSMVFIGILTFPFWDLIIQKGIKTIFEVSGVLEPKIYAYPEKDENGMIESLNIEDIESNSIGHFVGYLKLKHQEEIFENISISQFRVDAFYKSNSYLNKIRDFIEIKIFDGNSFSTNQYRYLRIMLNGNEPQFEYIDKNNDKARYKFIWKDITNFYLFGLGGQAVIDKETEKMLAQSYSITFNEIGVFESLRNDILLFKSGASGEVPLFSVKGFNTNRELFNKIILGE